NVALEFNTNCTVLREPMLQKLLKFQFLQLGLSLDAFGPYYEYIRYPAKWDTVRRNVEKLRALGHPHKHLWAGVVLQVYNVLNLVEVLDYFDTLGITFGIEFALSPEFLNVDVLPGRVRKLAAERLRDYAARRCRPENLAMVESTAQRLEAIRDKC